MNRRLCSLAKLTIAIFMLMAVVSSPLYCQETSQKTSSEVAQMDREDSRFALSAGETLAIPVKRLTPEMRADASQTTGSRFALSAGGTPAIPVKRLSGVSNEAAEVDFARNASGAPVLSTNQSKNQKANEPFVFPTRKERFNRYVKSMFGPSALIRSAVNAGINQWKDNPDEWEQGASGYGKRFASSFGRNAIHHTVIYGLDSSLGLDTGFRRSGRKKFGDRLVHALLENITSRTKTGKRVFSVPRIAGAYTSGVISREAWYPERYGYKDGLRSGTNTLLMGFALNVVREFVVKF